MSSLPKDILIKRLENEYRICQNRLPYQIKLIGDKIETFPVKFRIFMKNCPGPMMRNDKILTIYNHEFKISVGEKYPYQKPIIHWDSDIFHPNIMPPEEGGDVCTKLLDTWNFNSDLLSLIKGIESLLINLNPKNPLGSDTCTRAAEYFNKNSYKPPNIMERVKKMPVIITK